MASTVCTVVCLVFALVGTALVHAMDSSSELLDRCPELCDCSTGGIVDCSSRGITRLPATFPAGTVVVDISGNNISQIGGHAFSTVPEISSINLENCNIEQISPYAFDGLVNITNINLRYNNLSKLASFAFQGIRGHCDNSTSENCVIDLSFNPVQRILPHAFKNVRGVSVMIGNHDGTLSLGSLAFTGLENGALLSISNISNIEFRSALSFRGLKNVKTVFIGHSRINKIKARMFYGAVGLTKITFQSCNILEVDGKAFTGAVFNLEKNCNETAHHLFDTFDEMVTSGKIEIRDSVIDKLPYKTFEASNAGGITLFGNDIKHIEQGAFRDLKQLCYLKLTRNRIPALTSGIFSGLKNVRVIEIQNNYFSAIENGAFGHVSHIGRIVISLKDVPSTVTIKSNAFRGLTHVGVIHFNHINAEFEQFAFSGVFKLKALRIEHLNEKTNLTKMPKNVFNGLDVKKLYLQSAGNFKPEKGIFDSLAVDEVKVLFGQLTCGCEEKQITRVLKNVAEDYTVMCRAGATPGSSLSKNTEIQDFDFEDCDGTSNGYKAQLKLSLVLILTITRLLFQLS